MNTEKYNAIVESIVEKVRNSELTLEEADEVESLAYEKYMVANETTHSDINRVAEKRRRVFDEINPKDLNPFEKMKLKSYNPDAEHMKLQRKSAKQIQAYGDKVRNQNAKLAKLNEKMAAKAAKATSEGVDFDDRITELYQHMYEASCDGVIADEFVEAFMGLF